jgi:hypothetical protein
MSKREDVLLALVALITGNAAGATVLRNQSLPKRVPSAGLVIIRDGDPGEPEVTLSPLTYIYDHLAVVEVVVEDLKNQDVKFDAICVAIGARIEANRTLGGLCDWVEGLAPEPVEVVTEGGEPMKAAIVSIMLKYSTISPI